MLTSIVRTTSAAPGCPSLVVQRPSATRTAKDLVADVELVGLAQAGRGVGAEGGAQRQPLTDAAGLPRGVVGMPDLLVRAWWVGPPSIALLEAEFRVSAECGKLSELPPKPEWGDKDADEHTSQQHGPEIDDPARDRHDQDEIEPGQPPPHDHTAVVL